MDKKCIICEKPASYKIKDTNDFYCEECAEENFGDLSMLVKVEEEVTKLKEVIKEKLKEVGKDEKMFDDDKKLKAPQEIDEDYDPDKESECKIEKSSN